MQRSSLHYSLKWHWVITTRFDSSKGDLTPSDWNQLMLEIQALSDLFEDSDALSEEVKAMFEQKKKTVPLGGNLESFS